MSASYLDLHLETDSEVRASPAFGVYIVILGLVSITLIFWTGIKQGYVVPRLNSSLRNIHISNDNDYFPFSVARSGLTLRFSLMFILD
jgi:hypothetical protein